jgi:hypothetical protein
VTKGTGLKIPGALEDEIDVAVTRHLETELGARGLLLSSADLAIAESTTAALGRRLMARLLQQCYPEADDLTVEFERTGDIARIGAALAFGAVTSRVLARADGRARRPLSTEYVCGVFNLAIGLIDGICDGDVDTGTQLLANIFDADLYAAATRRRDHGWLHTSLPNFLATDDAVAFTVSVTEAFYDNLHDLYADQPEVRRIVGEQLADALKAESDSVQDPFAVLSPERRVECSRTTSVLPFNIIETITTAGRAVAVPSRATVLGEAIWRIDDLVDIVDDARSGALNAVLLDAGRRRGHHGGYDMADLSAVLASSGIESAAAEAADRLQAGLGMGAIAPDDRFAYLGFVQRYAGIEPTL